MMLMLLLGTACRRESGKPYELTVVREWPAAAVQRLQLGETDGSVSVNASPKSTIHLVAHIHSQGTRPRAGEPNAGFFSAELQGGTLAIRTLHRHQHRFFFLNHDEVSVDYTLEVPPTTTLDIRTVNGYIRTRGVDGATEVATVNGQIDIEAPGGHEVEARTVNGDVMARFSNNFQGANLRTVNGRVRASLPPSASFACDLSQVNGDVESNFPLNVHSNPGSRRATAEVNGGRFELRLATVNGDIGLDTLPPRPPTPPQALPAMPEPPAVPEVPIGRQLPQPPVPPGES